MVRGVLVPPAGGGVVLRPGQAEAQVAGRILSGDLVAAGLFTGVGTGGKAALQQITRVPVRLIGSG